MHHDLVVLSFCLCLSVRQYAPEERKAEGRGKEETKNNVEGRNKKGERRKLMKQEEVSKKKKEERKNKEVIRKKKLERRKEEKWRNRNNKEERRKGKQSDPVLEKLICASYAPGAKMLSLS